MGRQLTQLVVDQRQQLLGGVCVAAFDGRQEACDVAPRPQGPCCCRNPRPGSGFVALPALLSPAAAAPSRRVISGIYAEFTPEPARQHSNSTSETCQAALRASLRACLESRLSRSVAVA